MGRVFPNVEHSQMWRGDHVATRLYTATPIPKKYDEAAMFPYIEHVLSFSPPADSPDTVASGTAESIRIIPISGGWDSTAYLYWYLRNTDCEVHAHHIHMHPTAWRAAEAKAVCSIVAEAKKIRDFVFTESRRDYEATDFRGFDVQYAAYIGFLISKDYHGKNRDADIEVCIGSHKDEMDRNAEEALVSRVFRAWLMFDALFADVDRKQRPHLTWDLCHLSKTELMREIPEDVRKHVWSCIIPSSDGVACGKCMKCVEEKRFLKLL